VFTELLSRVDSRAPVVGALLLPKALRDELASSMPKQVLPRRAAFSLKDQGGRALAVAALEFEAEDDVERFRRRVESLREDALSSMRHWPEVPSWVREMATEWLKSIHMTSRDRLLEIRASAHLEGASVGLLVVAGALVLPAYVKHVLRSRTTDATLTIRRIYDSAVSYYEGERAAPDGGALPQGPAGPAAPKPAGDRQR
jgi:hypothetical protein